MAKIVGVRVDAAFAAYGTLREMHVGPSTYEREAGHFRVLRSRVHGNPWLSAMDKQFWWDYLYGPTGRAKTLGPATFNKDLHRCRAFMNFCHDEGWVSAEIPRYLETHFRYKTEHLSEHLILTPNQLLELPEHGAHSTHRVALATGANTALRGSEIMGIRLGNIRLSAGEMLVTLWKQSRDEIIPITSRLENEIRRWLVEYEQRTVDQGLGPLQPEWYLVPAQRPVMKARPGARGFATGDAPSLRLRPDRHPVQPYQIVQEAMDRMGLSYEIGEGFHTTRRGFARAFYDALITRGDTNALRKTSALLHHANTAMTERYLRLTTETMAVAQALKGVDFLGDIVDRSNVTQLRALS